MKYNEHFLLDNKTVIDYVKNRVRFFDEDEEVIAEEIGDGNINYVFRIVSKNNGKSLVVKQADKLLRSSQRPLDLNRNKIEAEILKLESKYAKEMVPEVYYYDEDMSTIIMEDISNCKNLRKELLSGRMYGILSSKISDFLANTLLPTTDLVMDRYEKKENVKKFTNPELCDISEDLVFTEPYYNYRDRNIITVGNEEFVIKKLYEDTSLHAEVGILRNKFMNYPQALIHGDLHSGSIFVNNERLVVIDPEFAFYGPIGYDVGNVIGNLIISYFYSKYISKNKDMITYLEDTISDIIDGFIEKFSKLYDELVDLPLYSNINFKEVYIEEVVSDSIGYAGTEIIRRVVGDSKVEEVTSIVEVEDRIVLERVLINTGIELIKNRYKFKSGSIIKIFLKKM